VQVETKDGGVLEFTTQVDMHEAIWSNISWKRFYLAEEAPICNGQLREVFGYNVDFEMGKEVLEGTYSFNEDFDEYMKDIFQEAAQTRSVIPRDSVSDIICHGEWGWFWVRSREETSCLESELNFSHYKAGAQSKAISHFHATRTLVVLKSGLGLERWSRGLSSMLEKIPCCHLILKL
jgi:hypothetical protein